MEYSKAKLKSNGDKSFPYFNPFSVGNMSGKCLPTRTLLLLSFIHIFISITGSEVIPNSTQYYSRPPSQPNHRLKVYKQLMPCFLVCYFLPNIWRTQKIWLLSIKRIKCNAVFWYLVTLGRWAGNGHTEYNCKLCSWYLFMLADLKRHQRSVCCCCEQRLPWCWTEEAAPWISQQLGLLVFHITVWFCVLHCVGVGSAYWR